MGFAVPSLLGRFGQGFCVGGGEKEAAVGSEAEGLHRVLSRGGRLHPASRSIWGEGSGEEKKIAPRGDKRQLGRAL